MRIFLFFVCVLVPLGLSATYYLAYASDRYISQAIFMVKTNSLDTSSDLDAASLLISSEGQIASEDERVMLAYVKSPDMLKFLDKKLALREHYQNEKYDPLSRLDKEATIDEFIEYYQNYLSIKHDPSTGLLNIEVQAFEAEYAHKMLKLILERSENFVNNISHDLAMEQVKFVIQELEQAKQNLLEEKQSLLEFQEAQKLFNPELEGSSVSSIISNLESDLARSHAELDQLLAVMNDDAHEVSKLKRKVKSLKKQIYYEKEKLVGQGAKDLNELNTQYQSLSLNIEFAVDAYTAALRAYEQARAEAARKLKYLVVVSDATLAEEAAYPRKLYLLLTIALFSLLAYWMVVMIYSIIKEHKD